MSVRADEPVCPKRDALVRTVAASKAVSDFITPPETKKPDLYLKQPTEKRLTWKSPKSFRFPTLVWSRSGFEGLISVPL